LPILRIYFLNKNYICIAFSTHIMAVGPIYFWILIRVPTISNNRESTVFSLFKISVLNFDKTYANNTSCWDLKIKWSKNKQELTFHWDSENPGTLLKLRHLDCWSWYIRDYNQTSLHPFLHKFFLDLSTSKEYNEISDKIIKFSLK